MKKKYIIMSDKDNCATTLADISKGEQVQLDDKLLSINQDIPLGHKFALKAINKGEKIFKYGQIIGIATENIEGGDWIHTHNITSHYLEEIVG
ncbi:MAG: altronate hydrolase [Candidatus Lokiarchaeota archaeon]|nr:altronate hydrolase [Candidatus Lokiarchaeota archaeon]MBD3340377.1 altronate hydrolase [Candidatus Lokiarchaeota archaeon]